MVRVIAGTARGRKLKTLDSENTKPTLDRVKEAMFSMIMPYIQGEKVFDAFAGNGSLGIEALSRGADFFCFNDTAPACCRIVQENLDTTGFSQKAEVFCNDFIAAANTLANRGETVGLVLLDPPYRQGLIEKMLTAPALEKICRKNDDGTFPPKPATVVCEHSAEDVLKEAYGKFVRTKTRRYGTVCVSVYQFYGSESL